jgi:hypothetical protein
VHSRTGVNSRKRVEERKRKALVRRHLAGPDAHLVPELRRLSVEAEEFDRRAPAARLHRVDDNERRSVRAENSLRPPPPPLGPPVAAPLPTGREPVGLAAPCTAAPRPAPGGGRLQSPAAPGFCP